MSFLGYGETPLYSNVNNQLVNSSSANNPANFGSNEIPGLNSPPYFPEAYYGVKSNVYAASGHATVKGGSRNRTKGGKKCCGLKGISTMKRKIKNIVKVYKMKGKKTIKNIKNSIKDLFSNRKTRFLAGGKKSMSKMSKISKMSKRIQNLQLQRSRSLALALAGGKKSMSKNIQNLQLQRSRSLALALAGGKKSMSKNIQNLQLQRSRSLALALAGGKRRTRKTSRGLKGGYSQYQNNLPMTQVYSLGDVKLPASELALANPPPYQVLSNCVNCVDNYNHYTNQGFPSKGH